MRIISSNVIDTSLLIIYSMFEAFTSLSLYSQMQNRILKRALNRLNKVVAQPNCKHQTENINNIIRCSFQVLYEPSYKDKFSDVMPENMQKEMFYTILKRTVSKHLKKYMAKIKEIINLCQLKKAQHQSDHLQNRIVNGVYGDVIATTLNDIEKAAFRICENIADYEDKKGWSCKCANRYCLRKNNIKGMKNAFLTYVISNSTQIFDFMSQQSTLNPEGQLSKHFRQIFGEVRQLQPPQPQDQLKLPSDNQCAKDTKKKRKRGKKQKKNPAQQTQSEEQSFDQNNDDRLDSQELRLINEMNIFELCQQKRKNCALSHQWSRHIKNKTRKYYASFDI